jgi:hypothetical protein
MGADFRKKRGKPDPRKIPWLLNVKKGGTIQGKSRQKNAWRGI